MSKAEIETYLTSLQKSGLVTKEQLASVLSQAVKAVGEPRLTSEILAEYYEKAGHVTPWHNEKLLKGKYKGFFLGNYRLLGHIATGGMSNIYLAEHVAMRRRVAVKVLPPTLTNNSSHLNRFYIESRVIASLDHPNIVRAYDVSQQGNFHYLVMEYVEGTDMRRLVQEDGVLPYELAADYLKQACDGLYHAHQKGLVHRDVKPANLLVDRSGVVKVLDMGLTRITDSGDPSLTLAHNEKLIGTVDYIAPEQAQNSHDVDARADIYSLGCTLYFLLVGQPPFNDGTQTHRLLSHATKEPPPVRQFRTDLPADLEHIIRKMMMKRREQRYQSAGEVSRELAGWLAARGAGAPPPASSVGVSAHSLPILPPGGPAGGPLSGAAVLPPTGAAEGGSPGQAAATMGPVSAMMMAPPVGPKADASSSSTVGGHPAAGEVPSSLDTASQQRGDGEHHPGPGPGSGGSTLRLQAMLTSRMEQLGTREAQLEQRQAELDSRLKHLDDSESRLQRQNEEIRRAKEQLDQLEAFLEEKSGLLERQSEELQEGRRQLAVREQQVVEWVNKVREQIGADLAAQGHTGFDADVVQRLQQLDEFLEQKARMLEAQAEQIQAKIYELDVRESRIIEREALCDVRQAMIARDQQAARAAEAQAVSPEEGKARQTLESLENFLEQKASWVENETAHVQEEKSKLEKHASEIRDVEAAMRMRSDELDAREASFAEHFEKEALLFQREASVIERESATAAREASLVERHAALAALEAALVERDLTTAAREREVAELRAAAERARQDAAQVQAQMQQARADLLKRQEQLGKQADEFTAKARSVQKTLADLDRFKQELKRREHELAVREGRAPAVLNGPSSVDMTQAAAVAASVAQVAAQAAAAAVPSSSVEKAVPAAAAAAAPESAEPAPGTLPNPQ